MSLKHHLNQRSPNFLAPETDFAEDNFATDRGGDGERHGGGSNASDGE